MAQLDPDICYRALQARDTRFDGRIFVAVTATKIYCRPVCPASPARFENCRFFSSAAGAQVAGFRPCLRCRPETTYELGSFREASSTVSRALTLIAEGPLDGDDAHMDNLAERLGVGERQLRRLFQQHLGASPIAVAHTRRLLFAKQLIHETRLPMTEIALSAGFGSVRRFNETFQALFRRPPCALRNVGEAAVPAGSVATAGVTVRLRYRSPYDWPAMLSYLQARAIEGIERVQNECYIRTTVEHGQVGTVEVRHVAEAESLSATIRFPSVTALPGLVARIRRVFDLDADVSAIGLNLARDPLLAPLVAERPGLRAPGGWDGFELAVRAILGQQVSVEAGRRLVGQLVALTASADQTVLRTFPLSAQVAAANLGSMKIPNARKQTLVELAKAALANPRLFQPLGTIEETVARLRAIRGIGDWTAHYIALRAAREPDAFPATDVGLLRSVAKRTTRLSAAQLLERAERWRPWRAYAAQHLWAADAAARTAKQGET
jgi:AraC family transcriptional regulator of adaptative response / DNA-3-methyladenine glycosylase II